ncbi:MAG: energy-coupling factor transporter transmembrane protein EcfT [Atopobiaceae bacterium]|jgi:cobalt/nickel transport system permease protein|nr:energy-coupling factor transporter transmembrane protein EcfT [Atopobiaceae bacterium]MCI2173586.1 energy-coupling factor transporter transmembrane protein EcfT [Atopobiaceae bacterium]MCI2207772.1 energy-coupling factor transporter transmembrane protein EcfT [Atopobiaceae bacterium]
MADPSSQVLPDWLVADDAYVPSRDRDGFLRRNVLRLTGLLTDFQVGAASYGRAASPVDRALGAVPTCVRMAGLLVCLVCVSAASNMAFVYLMLALVLVAMASRPAPAIVRQLRPAAIAAAVSALLMVPAALLGQPSAPVRMAVRVLTSLCLVLGLSQNVPWNRLVAALRAFHLSAEVILVMDLALKDLQLLGRAALELTEAIALRSVGVDRDRTASAAGVMGVCFLRMHDHAARQSEAMACRGFTGVYEVPAERVLTPSAIVYLAGIALLVCCFCFLEGAM